MKRWMALLISLILLMGLTGTATAETAFKTNCDVLLGTMAEELDLPYTVTPNDDGLTFASITFNYAQNKIIARDATFQGVITDVKSVYLLASLYQTLELYKKMRISALDDSDDFVILLVLEEDSEDGTITIDQDNHDDVKEDIKQLLIKSGYPEDAPLFSDSSDQADAEQAESADDIAPEATETSQPQTSSEQPKTVAAQEETTQAEPADDIAPEAAETSQPQTSSVQPKTVAAQESGASNALPSLDTEPSTPTAVASAYPNARDGLDWLSYHLKLTDAYLLTGEDLQELRSDLDSPDAQYLKVCFTSPDQDILTSDLDSDAPYIHLFFLCDRYGNLYRFYVQSVNFLGIEDGHSADEYAESFDMVFEVDADAQPEDFLLYLAGPTGPEFFTFGATFSVPNRQLECEGNSMWLANYDDGAWLDWDDSNGIEDNEKPLCLHMVTADEQLITSPEPISNIKLVDAANNQYGVRRSIVYQRDNFEMNGGTKITGYYLVFYIPKDSDFSDYSLTAINEAEDVLVPVVVP